MVHKVIFDTDPGVDDAMALFYAFAHPEIEVVGVTATFGNVSVKQAAANALYLTEICGRKNPVMEGVSDPWVKLRELPPDYIHGADGLGNLPTRKEITSQLDPRSAAQFIVETARANPGEITLVAVAPLGNLSLALRLEPKLPQLLKEIVLMGGALTEPGNVSPVAEANVWNDPHAADQVFCAGWKLTMVGLDVTHRVVVPQKLVEKIASKHQCLASDTLLHAVSFYANFYSARAPEVFLEKGCFAHDVLTFIYLTNPELFKKQSGKIRVLQEGIGQGQTVINSKPNADYPQSGWGEEIPICTACIEVDSAGCLHAFEKTLMGDWL